MRSTQRLRRFAQLPGSTRASQGAGELADGAGRLFAGTQEVAAGAVRADNPVKKLNAGAGRLSTGALAAVAGYSVGQDYSERISQLRPPAPQFSLGKSFPNFGPFGPAVVTADELDDPANLRVTAVLEGPGTEGKGEGGWRVQGGSTRDMIFPVARIISELSKVTTLYPGDIIFTGTPAGVGKAHGIILQPGNVLTSTIEGIGTIRNSFHAASGSEAAARHRRTPANVTA